jgi:chromate transporter
VLAIVIEALIRVARRALTRTYEWWLAAAAFVALYVFAAPFPVVILVAALAGLLSVNTPGAHRPATSAASWQRAVRTALFWLALWLLPLGLISLYFGSGHVYTQLAFFFSKLAVVTFGGAYAVLSYMAQQAVGTYGWLTAREMVDGLGLAETTPGPLILVTEFVGFLAGYRSNGLRGGVSAAAITLWMTFVPCFLWVMTAAPYVEKLRGSARLSGALSAITAAVVGVILNLSLWFGLHVMFRSVTRMNYAGMQPYVPDIASLDFASLGLSAVAVLALFRFKLGILGTLALCAALGALLTLL